MSADALLETVVGILRDAGKGLSPGDIRDAWQTTGMNRAAAEKAWALVQKLVKAHPQVGLEGSRYRWIGPELPEVSAVEAFELLLKDGLPGPRRTALAGVVREALATENDKGDAARRRQAQIDAVRQLAELASEVEELIANQTDPPVMIRQVRAWVSRSGLAPVGKAGEATRFDRAKHRPIMGPIRDGASVTVVRPGYIWNRGGEDVLLGKAIVEE